jgi:octaprenyl-diphosphate synthase
MLAHAARMVARIGNARIVQQFAEGVVQTATGEIEEFMHLGNIALPHETYLNIITGKTAWSLRCSCEIPAIYAKRSEEEIRAAATFGLELGIAFQVVDDALDIAPPEHTGKPSGGDLRERKCTPLNQLYWRSLPQREADAFAERFAKASFSDGDIDAVIKTMRARGLDMQVREMAGAHLARAEEALTRLPGGVHRDLLARVPGFIRSRGN